MNIRTSLPVLSPSVSQALDRFHKCDEIVIDYRDHDPTSEPDLVAQALSIKEGIIPGDDASLVTAHHQLGQLGVGLRFVDESCNHVGFVPAFGDREGTAIFAVA